MSQLSATTRRKIALKAIQTMKRLHGKGYFSQLAKKAGRTRQAK